MDLSQDLSQDLSYRNSIAILGFPPRGPYVGFSPAVSSPRPTDKADSPSQMSAEPATVRSSPAIGMAESIVDVSASPKAAQPPFDATEADPRPVIMLTDADLLFVVILRGADTAIRENTFEFIRDRIMALHTLLDPVNTDTLTPTGSMDLLCAAHADANESGEVQGRFPSNDKAESTTIIGKDKSRVER